MESLNRYKDSIALFKELESVVNQIEVAETREEVEQLELKTRNCFKNLMMKLPFIDKDIHAAALKRTQEIALEEVK